MRKARIISGLLLLGIILAQGAALADPDVIRLHVIANSNDFQDQALKENIRDSVVKHLGPKLSDLDEEYREKFLYDNLAAIESLVVEEQALRGYEYPVQVRYVVDQYPPRTYGYAFLPAGRYRSLQIIIGAGEGDNWWCLLFPPLCFTGGTVAEAKEGGNEVRFWLWEQIKKWFKAIWGGRE